MLFDVNMRCFDGELTNPPKEPEPHYFHGDITQATINRHEAEVRMKILESLDDTGSIPKAAARSSVRSSPVSPSSPTTKSRRGVYSFLRMKKNKKIAAVGVCSDGASQSTSKPANSEIRSLSVMKNGLSKRIQ